VAKAGDVIKNPVTGETMEFLQTARDTDGKLLRIMLTARPGAFPVGGMPHVHIGQEEIFRVQAGSLRFWLGGGKPRDVAAGEEIVLPPDVPHYWENVGAETARAVIELRPALRVEELFETVFGLARDGKTDAKGRPHPLQMAVIVNEYRAEVAPMSAADRALFAVVPLLALVGRSLGYRANYPEYATSGGVTAGAGDRKLP
jgi:quercetin dioxygenase-like cupin family protein